MKDELKGAEMKFKKLFIHWLTFKESADLIDNYEHVLSQHISEGPQVTQSINKQHNNISAAIDFFKNYLFNNVNYETEFCKKEVNDMFDLLDDIENLNAHLEGFHKMVDVCKVSRAEVNQKKFSDPDFVLQEYTKVMEANAKRDFCKKIFDRIKSTMKQKRDDYGDL